jgi:ribosomal protein S5
MNYEFNLVMNDREEQMGEVIVTMNSKKQVQGITTFEVIRKIPGNAGIENILKTLPGVNSNNELSTQYAVRVEIMMRI